MYSDLFGDYDKLLRVSVLGKEIEMPEKNTLLRGFQFVAPSRISYGQFCWNGTCHNCTVVLKNECGNARMQACRLEICEGMQVTSLSSEIKRNLL
jgi:hypothetical protein